MTDWGRLQSLLLDDSERLFQALFAEYETRGEALAAIGYVFEFGSGQLCFDLCANSVRHAAKMASEDRWNSGDYDHPGGADHYGCGWSKPWWSEMERLDQLAQDDDESAKVHDGIARICCNVLAMLARRGDFGDWSAIDFNVATLLDDLATVTERDARIRELITSTDEPHVEARRHRSRGRRLRH